MLVLKKRYKVRKKREKLVLNREEREKYEWYKVVENAQFLATMWISLAENDKGWWAKTIVRLSTSRQISSRYFYFQEVRG